MRKCSGTLNTHTLKSLLIKATPKSLWLASFVLRHSPDDETGMSPGSAHGGPLWNSGMMKGLTFKRITANFRTHGGSISENWLSWSSRSRYDRMLIALNVYALGQQRTLSLSVLYDAVFLVGSMQGISLEPTPLEARSKQVTVQADGALRDAGTSKTSLQRLSIPNCRDVSGRTPHKASPYGRSVK